MPWLLVIDEECMDLLDGAAEMASAALAARSRRVDEDGVIKRSVDMSRIKLETLRQSMHTAPLGDWHDLEPNEVVAVYNLLDMFKASETMGERDAIWKTLRAYMLRPGKEKPFQGGSQPWSDEDLRKPRVADPAKADAPGKAGVRSRVRKRRARDTPPEASE